MESWHLVSPSGERWSAGAAAPPLMRLLPGGRLPAKLLAAFPNATERAYRFTARHRGAFGRLFRSPPTR
jgi:predicted DCC family thiol-disulfide oxidoreductase YuxK